MVALVALTRAIYAIRARLRLMACALLRLRLAMDGYYIWLIGMLPGRSKEAGCLVMGIFFWEMFGGLAG